MAQVAREMATTSQAPPSTAVEMQPLFAQCRFGINWSRRLSEAAMSAVDFDNLVQSIESHGGTLYRGVPIEDPPDEGLPDDDVQLHELTHIVSTTIDFPQYDKACQFLIPVVKPAWIDASIRKCKIAPPRQYSPDPRLFLSSVVLYCADLPEGDVEAIVGGVIAMGGSYTRQLTKLVTHIVALDVDSDKCSTAKAKLSNVKIVLPHWFDDCLRLGRRLNERPYLLPNPEVLRNTDQPIRHVENKHIIGASTPDPIFPAQPTSPSANRKQLRVFLGKRVVLSSDLKIGSRLRGKLEELIQQGGGSLTCNVDKAHMFICRYREGRDYMLASRQGSDVGNLAWLYHLITHNTWTSPLNKLLHYPVVRGGIPGFKNFKISLSNYSGEARTYLENLITAAGGEVTKSLKPSPENTHLITAHPRSEKVTAARDWGIEVVNHLWLEESYSKWMLLPISTPRYTHWPHRTNLEEVVGQITIDREAIQKNFLVEDSEDEEMEEMDEPAKPMKPKDGNLFPNLLRTSSGVESPGRAAQLSRATKSKESTPKASKFDARVNDLRTPAASRFISEGKENDTPGTGSSRKAKEAATAKLHDYAPDMALYEKEKKRVGGVIYGGPRPKDDKQLKGHAKKRSLDDGSTTASTDGPEPKRAKKFTPHVNMKLMLSGYKRWLPGSGHNQTEDRERLRSLGIMVVTDPKKCTHLAAPQILRTHKFVTALAYAPTIITTEFVDQCLEREEFLEPQDFILRDTTTEKRLKLSLSKSLSKAKANQNKLLRGRTIYCLETVHTGPEVIKSIIEANGGECKVYTARSGIVIPSRRAENGLGDAEDEDADALYLISGAKKDQVKLWPRFVQMAESQKWRPRIVTTDWLLDQAMAQELRWDKTYEVSEKDVFNDE